MFNFFKKKQQTKKEKDPKLGYTTGPILGKKGFVNEKVCDADIKKYKLQEISSIDQIDLDKGYSYYHWAIDREREIWFTYKESEKSNIEWASVRDPEYYTGNGVYVLYYKGEIIEVILKEDYDEQRKKNELSNKNPYYIIWNLIRIIKPDSLKDTPDEEIVGVLKEALSVYAEETIHTSVPEEIIRVEFKF